MKRISNNILLPLPKIIKKGSPLSSVAYFEAIGSKPIPNVKVLMKNRIKSKVYYIN